MTADSVLDDSSVIQVLDSEGHEANFSDLFVGDDICRVIAENLMQNTTKQNLIMRGNHICADGASAIAEVLKVNHTITALNLEWNSVGMFDHGMETLASALEVNRSLTSLDLRNNSISSTGGRALARCLKTNTTLKSLDVRWNEIGNEGARAIKDALSSGRSGLETLHLGGNKIESNLLENIEALIKNKGESSPHQATALRDDLHIARERAEQLEARLRRTAAEEVALRTKEAERDAERRAEQDRAKDIERTLRSDMERQLQIAAVKAAEMEEEIIVQKGKVVDLTQKYDREKEAKEKVQDELERTKASNLETTRELKNTVSKLQFALESANEDRRTAQREQQHARELLEKELLQVKEDLQQATTELEVAERNIKRLEAIKHQQDTALETAHAETRLVKERIDEHISMAARATAEGRALVEDTRRMYEERIESVKLDAETKVRSAEERTKASEYERHRMEVTRQALNNEIMKLQVQLEEKVVEVERSVRDEQQKRYESELVELKERVEAIQQSRALQDANVRDLVNQLESSRQHSAAEAREFARELSRYRDQLEAARESARVNEGKAAKLSTESGVLQRKVENFQQRCEELDRDRTHAAEVQQANADKVAAQQAGEMRGLERQLQDAKSVISTLEGKVKDSADQLSSLQTHHKLSMTALEKHISQSLADAFEGCRARTLT